MRILSFTTLYPNAEQPRHGVFVEQRLQRLAALPDVELQVVAPVPWFPSRSERFGGYGAYARVPEQEQRQGLTISHPRYPVIPKLNLGMNVSPLLLARSVLPKIKQLQADGFDFDLIDAHYYYPDGVAAALLGKWLNKPFVVTARGNDLSLLPDHAVPKRWIQWAAKRSAASICVCQALADRLIELGAAPATVHVLRNGVDMQLFNPSGRDEARQRLGIARPTLLLAGHLIERKGQHIAIEAMSQLAEFDLLLVGGGPERSRLEKLAQQHNVSDRVKFIGEVSHSEIADYYRAADILLLPSSREGIANVLLESMACGTPVVATAVWGTPEVVTATAAGRMMSERSAAALVASVRELFTAGVSPAATRKHAEQFDWPATIDKLHQLFADISSEFE